MKQIKKVLIFVTSLLLIFRNDNTQVKDKFVVLSLHFANHKCFHGFYPKRSSVTKGELCVAIRNMSSSFESNLL